MRKFFVKSLVSCFLATSMALSTLPVIPVIAEEDVTVLPKDKISESVYEMLSSGEEKIPTVLWLQDIDDSLIERQIMNNIGIDINSLDGNYERPSDELIKELENVSMDNESESLETLMKNYMELTASEREAEKIRTDKYLEERGKVLEKFNVRNSKKLISELNLDYNRIGFISSYVPMIVATLSPEEIIKASENKNITEISKFEVFEDEECSINFGNSKEVMGINKINSLLNLTGLEVSIGIYEGETVSSTYYDENGLSSSNVTIIGNSRGLGSHPTYCAGVAVGVAPDANIFSASMEEDLSVYPNYPSYEQYESLHLNNLETMMNDVDIVNISYGAPDNNDCYNNRAKYFDKLINTRRKTIVAASGNSYGSNILNNATAYNCITVNGFIDNYNNINENIVKQYSYLNGNGCLKPDVTVDCLNYFGGTSTAAAYTSGMIALLYQYKPSLKAYPEVTKAILMASCHKKCTKQLDEFSYGTNNTTVELHNSTEYMSDNITNRQGAGIPNMYTMISIVSNHNYGCGVFNTTHGYSRSLRMRQPKYDSNNINIVMAYLQTNVPTSSTSGTIDNYALYVQNNGTTNCSDYLKSSTEMLYSQLNNDPNYRISIQKISGLSTNIKYGYAWSTDKEYFNDNREEEGLYYIKNSQNALYLACNTSSGNIIQDDFVGSNNTLWILDNISSTKKYRFKNAIRLSEGVGVGSLISSNVNYAKDLTNNTITVSIQFNDDGTARITHIRNGHIYALGVKNNSSEMEESIIWEPYSESNRFQKWYLESVNYKIGDVNGDGVISTSDKTLLQSYISGTTSLNNMKKYLADVNKDDVINSLDVNAITSLINNS